MDWLSTAAWSIPWQLGSERRCSAWRKRVAESLFAYGARLLFVNAARWRHRPLRWWSLDDLRLQYRRMLKQKQGQLENAASSDLFHEHELPFEDMPRTVQPLITGFAQRRPAKAAEMARSDRNVSRLLSQMTEARDWSLAERAPMLVHRTAARIPHSAYT